jgi:hypothetical protein
MQVLRWTTQAVPVTYMRVRYRHTSWCPQSLPAGVSLRTYKTAMLLLMVIAVETVWLVWLALRILASEITGRDTWTVGAWVHFAYHGCVLLVLGFFYAKLCRGAVDLCSLACVVAKRWRPSITLGLVATMACFAAGGFWRLLDRTALGRYNPERVVIDTTTLFCLWFIVAMCVGEVIGTSGRNRDSTNSGGMRGQL